MASILAPSDTVPAGPPHPERRETSSVEKMASPTVPLLPDKRNGTNIHSSPGRTKKTTATNTDKKPLLNGHASPSHLVAIISTNPANKPIVEGFLKTDDRMRLAKERREERDRSLAAREQLIREKERRAQLQYERTVEERWKRMEEQRNKEELRRAAVEEKRRLQLEEERERLEAVMKRSLERSLTLENRHKRWSRAGDSENAPLSFSAASALSHGLASPLPAVSESAPCSPRRSPLYSSRSPADSHRSGLLEGSQSTPNTPKKERLRKERRTGSPGGPYSKRRSESPVNIARQMTSPTTSRLASKTHMQSPSNVPEYHHSPNKPRHLNNNKAQKGGRGGEKRGTFFEMKSEHVVQNREKKRGKPTNGITNAEEASKLLAERRRQARAQKELDDKKGEQACDERLYEKQQIKQDAQEQWQHMAKESGENVTVSYKATQQEKQEKEPISTEREKAKVQAEEVQRQRQDREQQSQQDEEERQLRKKRIEQIMRRTRKGEADVKDEQVESRSPPGEVEPIQSKAQEDFIGSKEQVASNREGEKAAAGKMDHQKHVENNAQVLPAHSVPDKRMDSRKMIVADELNKEGVDVLQQVQGNANKQPGINFKDPFAKEPTNEAVKQNEMNGAVKWRESVPMRGQVKAEVSKQKAASSASGHEGRGPQPPPAIHLKPLEVKQSRDEVQSMDVSPSSKEELISIPEFSPVNETQQCGLSNTRALQDLMDLTGSVTCPKKTSEDNVGGDYNKNLIQGVVTPTSDSKIVGMSLPSSTQLNIN
ncbi:MAP7 domain-containing protein 2a [Syngnathus acus]|uniref:MAP7 domain-containing protein 2a n=1 Tax=Syngnathus acus TaxID=161584 RepID=UPI0018864164|nr:MAP7 domain-containing protein 2a [Syngnathus acus]